MYKDFIKLTIPNILTNLTVPLVSLVDVMLMGHMDDSNYIIAIGLSVAIFNFMYWAFGFLRMGTTGQVAQAHGRNDFSSIQQTLVQGLIIAFFIGLLFVLLQVPILELCKSVINVVPSSMELIDQYFTIRIVAAPASIAIFVMNGWLLGIHKSKAALYLAIVINSINIVLSYVLVTFYNKGISGVAIGTVIAQASGLLFGFYLIYREYKWSWLAYLNSKMFKLDDWKQFLNVNGDLFIRTLCLLFALTFFKINAAELEITLGAANLLLLEFVGLSAYGVDGLAFAAESISGKYYGAGNKAMLKKSIKVAFQIGLSIGLIGSVVFLVFGELILRLLTDQVNVIEVAKPYLIWVIIAPFVHSVAFIWDGIYIGCTASKQMKWSLLISTFIVFLPSYYLFNSLFGNHGIWLSLTLFMAARGIIQTVLAKRGIYDRL